MNTDQVKQYELRFILILNTIRALYFHIKFKEKIFIFIVSLSLFILSAFIKAGTITMTCAGPTIFFNFNNPEDVMRTGKALVFLTNQFKSQTDLNLPEEEIKKQCDESLYSKYYTEFMLSLVSEYAAKVMDQRNGKPIADIIKDSKTEKSCKNFVALLRKDVPEMPDGEIKAELKHILDENTTFNAPALGREDFLMRNLFIKSGSLAREQLDTLEGHNSNSEESNPSSAGILLMAPIAKRTVASSLVDNYEKPINK